jgi:ATP-dependent RNA helicase DOB1
MSGRARLRRWHQKSYAILIDRKISASVGRNLIKGQADVMNPVFHLTYNIVLNLLRVLGINPE